MNAVQYVILILPRTNYHLTKDNPVERLFVGQIPFGTAYFLFLYEKGSVLRVFFYRLVSIGRNEKVKLGRRKLSGVG